MDIAHARRHGSWVDSAVTAAARALSSGDPLRALDYVALRDDPPALALRGVAMAQLGDLARARALLARAVRAFGPREVVARARCALALAEIALATRDLAPDGEIAAAITALDRVGDRDNATYGRVVALRQHVLLGRVAEAERLLDDLDATVQPPRVSAFAWLARAQVALRQARASSARRALAEARAAAARAGIPALTGEVDAALGSLDAPAARLVTEGRARAVRLDEIERVLSGEDLVVDACRRALRLGSELLSLARRPVLFAILRALAEAWPGAASREDLIRAAFGAARMNEAHRASLRVEVGRLRRAVRAFAEVVATGAGYAIRPTSHRVVVVAPPVEGPAGALFALLGDGEAWSTSSLALALGTSQRQVQRALAQLEEAGQARSVGRGRSQRWVATPIAGFTTVLLLAGTAAHA